MLLREIAADDIACYQASCVRRLAASFSNKAYSFSMTLDLL